MDRTCPRRASWPLLAVLLLPLVFAGCEKDSALGPDTTPELSNSPDDADPGPVNPSVPSGAAHRHKLIVALEMTDFEQPGRIAQVTRGFDSFLYGHIGAHENEVTRLESQGLESMRYFNVLTTDPNYATWGGFYSELHSWLAGHNGWIPGVAYPFFSDPRNPDRIIDHTRGATTNGVTPIIRRWANTVHADRIFLDLAYDHLEDWMIRPGDHWPWPASMNSIRQADWRRNMQSLVRNVGEPGRVMVNGSPDLGAAIVLYENEVWNDRRGYRPWSEVVQRMQRSEAIPALHVGHHHVTAGQAWFGEMMVLGVWLLADESYILIEPEGRPLAWAREIQARGYQRFVATEPVRQPRSGVYTRRGTIDGQPWRVEVDMVAKVGRVTPIVP